MVEIITREFILMAGAVGEVSSLILVFELKYCVALAWLERNFVGKYVISVKEYSNFSNTFTKRNVLPELLGCLLY